MTTSQADNLAHRLLQGALDRGLGGRPALRQDGACWSYAELADRVARYAGALAAAGVAPGDRVALLVRDTLDGAAALLAVIHAGAVAAPMSELARASDLAAYLALSGAAVAVADRALATVLDEARGDAPALREVLLVGVGGEPPAGARALAPAATPAAAAAVAPAAPCLLLFSAGAPTEELRGVVHSHASASAAVRSFGDGLLGLTEADRVFSAARLATAFGLGVSLLLPLAAGAESILLPAQAHTPAVFEVLARDAPTVVCATPSLFSQLAHDAADLGARRPLAGVRRVVSGGEGMPEQVIARVRQALGAEVVVGYGLTELLQLALAGTTGGGWDARPGTCGAPLPGVEARLVDEHGAPVGPDAIGTLQLRAASACTHYVVGGVTAPATDADGWLTTRDRFLADRAGVFHHVGRVDELFKVSGKWVSPVEVERALTAHEAVWECAVIGHEDDDGLVKPFAFVVPNVGHPGGAALEVELRDYVKNSLAPYKYPRWIEFVDGLPRGPGGKLLRYLLRPARRRRRGATAAPGA